MACLKDSLLSLPKISKSETFPYRIPSGKYNVLPKICTHINWLYLRCCMLCMRNRWTNGYCSSHTWTASLYSLPSGHYCTTEWPCSSTTLGSSYTSWSFFSGPRALWLLSHDWRILYYSLASTQASGPHWYKEVPMPSCGIHQSCEGRDVFGTFAMYKSTPSMPTLSWVCRHSVEV